MSLRICRLGGTVLLTPFMVKMKSGIGYEDTSMAVCSGSAVTAALSYPSGAIGARSRRGNTPESIDSRECMLSFNGRKPLLLFLHIRKAGGTTLKDIIEAVQRMQDEQQQQQQGEPGQSDENPPLLPGSAELKLLRSAQLRINGRTAALGESQAGDAISADELGADLENLARRQRSVSDMAREMRDQSSGT